MCKLQRVAVLLLLAGSLLFAGDVPPWSDSTGKGEPTIVLLHGAGSDRNLWDLVLPALSASHRVVRVELPGHGASPMLEAITVKAVARAVDQALEKQHVERALLVGHSYGAWVALEEAVAKPKRVAAVAVIDMGSYTPQDTARTAALERYIQERYPSLVRAIFEVLSQRPAESDSAVIQALRVPREVMVAYLRDAWRTDLRRERVPMSSSREVSTRFISLSDESLLAAIISRACIRQDSSSVNVIAGS